MLTKFYWGTIRKSIVAFGNIFNDIYLDRLDASGNVIQSIKVPLAYAPRQKFLARINAEPDLPDEKFQISLPRMAFEMTGLSYDPTRKLSLVQQNRTVNNTTTTSTTQFVPTPYNVSVSLYVYSKNQDDGLQILEQILPYFNPDFNVTINAVPAMNIKNDLLIALDNVNYEDTYEGDFRSRRSILWTLNFTLKLNFFGPASRQSLIRTSIANIFNDEARTQQIKRYTVTVDPSTAVPGDDVDFIETFEDF
jgi:hypothetical protein